MTFIALLFSISSRVTLALFASLLSFVAALLTLIAFAIDIALYTIVHDRVRRLSNVQVHSVAAPGTSTVQPQFFLFRYSQHVLTGFWITLASLILLLMAGFIGWFGRRRSRMSGATDYAAPEKPGFLAKFRRFLG